MALVYQNFTLEVTPGMLPPVLHVTEYDINMQIDVTFTQRGQPYEIPSGTTAKVEGTIAGHPFRTNATVNGDTVTFILTGNMTAYAGRAWTKIVLTKDNWPVSTCGFWLDCDRAGVEADTVIGASGFEEQINQGVAEFLENDNKVSGLIQTAVDAYISDHGIQVKNAYVTPEKYGAKGDGATDDTISLQSAIDSGEPVICVNNYRITQPLKITEDRTVFYCTGTIKASASDAIIVNACFCDIQIAAVIDGTNCSPNDSATSKGYYVNEETDSNNLVQYGSYSGVTLLANADRRLIEHNSIVLGMVGCYGSGVKLSCVGNKSYVGVSYNTIRFQDIAAMKCLDFAMDGQSAGAFITENTFYGGRTQGNYGIYAAKPQNVSDAIAGNKFYTVGFEGLYMAYYADGFNHNTIESPRHTESFRSGTRGTFGANTKYNRIKLPARLLVEEWVDQNNQDAAACNIYETPDLAYGDARTVVLSGEVRCRNNVWIADKVTNAIPLHRVANDANLDMSAEKIAYSGMTINASATTKNITVSLNSGYGAFGIKQFYVNVVDATHRVRINISGALIENGDRISKKGRYLFMFDGSSWVVNQLFAGTQEILGGYTNQIPISIDTDSTIYQGVGYINGKRLNSSGGLTDQADTTTTGFIPIAYNSIIRMKGLDWEAWSANYRYCYVQVYDENFALLGSWNNNGATNGILHPNTNVQVSGGMTTFDLHYLTDTPTVTDVAYVRISAIGNGADGVVTVNENIVASVVLPPYSADDNNKSLKIIDGAPVWTS